MRLCQGVSSAVLLSCSPDKVSAHNVASLSAGQAPALQPHQDAGCVERIRVISRFHRKQGGEQGGQREAKGDRWESDVKRVWIPRRGPRLQRKSEVPIRNIAIKMWSCCKETR